MNAEIGRAMDKGDTLEPLFRTLICLISALSFAFYCPGDVSASSDDGETSFYVFIHWEACRALIPDFPQGAELKEQHSKSYGRDQELLPFMINIIDPETAKHLRILEDLENNKNESGVNIDVTASEGDIHINNSVEYSGYLVKYLFAFCHSSAVYDAARK